MTSDLRVPPGWAATGAPAGPDIPTSLTAEETAYLVSLAKDANVLEVGSGYGYSSIAMALGGARHVLAVDPHEWIAGGREAMQGFLTEYDVKSRVSIALASSCDVLRVLAEAGAKFDLVWVDGDHSRPAVENDLEWGLKLVRAGGSIAFHDYDAPDQMNPDVREVLDEQQFSRVIIVGSIWTYSP